MYDIEEEEQQDTTPRAEPVEQSIHIVKERQGIKRRLFLNRLASAGISFLLAGSGGAAGTLAITREREQMTLQSMQHEQNTAVQAAYQRGLAQGHAQGVRELAGKLASLNGVTPGQAHNSAEILQSLYDVFIVPLAASNASIPDMLNSLELARRIIMAAGDDTSAIDSLITILNTWQGNTSGLVKPLSQVSKSDTDMAASYLTALLTTLARS